VGGELLVYTQTYRVVTNNFLASGGDSFSAFTQGTSRRDANPYVDIPIVTGMREARNVIVVSSAQSVIAVSGSFGTLSEIAHALKLGIPVVGLSSWELSQEGRDEPRGIIPAADPADAVHKALALAIE
jgi:uncharacterized protein (TIGR00725 family)